VKYFIHSDLHSRGDEYRYKVTITQAKLLLFIKGRIDADSLTDKEHDQCDAIDDEMGGSALYALCEINQKELEAIHRKVKSGKPFGVFGEEAAMGGGTSKTAATKQYQKVIDDCTNANEIDRW